MNTFLCKLKESNIDIALAGNELELNIPHRSFPAELTEELREKRKN